MKTSSKCFSCLVFLIGSIPSWAFSAAVVTSTLAAHRISQHAEGKESLEPASVAKPGDVLEYVAEYKNAGTDAARRLEATLPIPVGTEYLAGSARPAPATASLDGKTFETLPLKRRLKQADGKIVDLPVPVSEYRYLRWAPQDLMAGASLEYSARAKLSSTQTP